MAFKKGMTAYNFDDLTGKTFNRLTVIKRVYRNNSKKVYWKCRCVCGKETTVESSKLKGGYTKSCGCLNNENRNRHINELTTHNMSNSKLFEVWCSMRRRCENRKDKAYKWYGAKGVKVCDEWQGEGGFQNFYNWSIKNGYKENLSIDRIDFNGNYEPSNCRWITQKEQCNNTSRNIYIDYRGERKTLSELCEMYNLKYGIMHHRICDLELPFEIAMNLKGFCRVHYKGKETDLRQISRDEKIEYKTLLKEVLVNKRDAIEQIILDCGGKNICTNGLNR